MEKSRAHLDSFGILIPCMNETKQDNSWSRPKTRLIATGGTQQNLTMEISWTSDLSPPWMLGLIGAAKVWRCSRNPCLFGSRLQSQPWVAPTDATFIARPNHINRFIIQTNDVCCLMLKYFPEPQYPFAIRIAYGCPFEHRDAYSCPFETCTAVLLNFETYTARRPFKFCSVYSNHAMPFRILRYPFRRRITSLWRIFFPCLALLLCPERRGKNGVSTKLLK